MSDGCRIVLVATLMEWFMGWLLDTLLLILLSFLAVVIANGLKTLEMRWTRSDDGTMLQRRRKGYGYNQYPKFPSV